MTAVNPCPNGGYPAGSANIDYTNASPADVSCELDIDGVTYYLVCRYASSLDMHALISGHYLLVWQKIRPHTAKYG